MSDGVQYRTRLDFDCRGEDINVSILRSLGPPSPAAICCLALGLLALAALL
ncbi:hypothetical protein KKH23_11140 [Patescibacteria group bacterium]|nr:hypothetical protein [Patescibacteria group bacterium]